MQRFGDHQCINVYIIGNLIKKKNFEVVEKMVMHVFERSDYPLHYNQTREDVHRAHMGYAEDSC